MFVSRRLATRALLIAAVALVAALPARAADAPPEVGDSGRRLINHLECAVAVGVADLTHYVTLAAAIFTCARAFFDEPNWFPGGN